MHALNESQSESMVSPSTTPKRWQKMTNKLRAEYYNFYTDKEWGHSSSYDLCIDSSRLPEEDVINQIISYVNARLAL